MPMRRPNLLDAFRRVNDLPATPAGGSGSVPTRAPSAPTGGAAEPTAPKPVAPVPARGPSSAPAARATPSADQPATNTMPSARIEPPAAGPTRPPRERLLILALALAVATLALVGLLRDSGEGAAEAVQAADSGSTTAAPSAPAPGPAVPTPTPKPAASDVARAPHDAALYDARNRYTVRLIHYPDGAQGLALATEAYHWLAKFGYPVASPILLAGGKGIVLCASAKPTQEELVPLRDNLRRLRYPESSKTMPFSTAYIDEIDDVLAR